MSPTSSGSEDDVQSDRTEVEIPQERGQGENTVPREEHEHGFDIARSAQGKNDPENLPDHQTDDDIEPHLTDEEHHVRELKCLAANQHIRQCDRDGKQYNDNGIHEDSNPEHHLGEWPTGTQFFDDGKRR